MLVRLICLLIVSVGCIAGCSQAPSRIEAPAWDPEGYADAVLSKLDKSGNGSLEKGELSAAPGLAWGARAIDTDKNGVLSHDELVARFALYKKMRLGLTTTQVQVSYKGSPLAGAKVTLVPEFFLADVIEPAVGEALPDGSVYPQVPNITPAGLRVGYYRVVVESPRVKIPAKYTKADSTTLGYEVSPVSDDGSMSNQFVLRD